MPFLPSSDIVSLLSGWSAAGMAVAIPPHAASAQALAQDRDGSTEYGLSKQSQG